MGVDYNKIKMYSISLKVISEITRLRVTVNSNTREKKKYGNTPRHAHKLLGIQRQKREQIANGAHGKYRTRW